MAADLESSINSSCDTACDDGCKDAPDPRRAFWVKLALFLGIASIVWNIGEAASGLYFGLIHAQLALSLFAAQSLVEVISAVMVLWRLCHEETGVPSAESQRRTLGRERLGTRVIGILFLIFSTAVCV